MVPMYLLAKATWSVLNDAMVVWAQRLPVESRSPEACNGMLKAAAPLDKPHWPTPWKPDPVVGIGDFYNNPNRVEWALRQPDPRAGAASLPSNDCDDTAAWAYVATRRWGGGGSRLMSLVDATVSKSHVICVGRRANGSWWAIDTNGLTELPDGDPATLCAIWGKMYGVNYVAAHDSPLFW